MNLLCSGGRQPAGRTNKGSVLAEFGPALGIFLMCFFFPLINFLGMFTTYGACYMLNSAQIQEAALLKESKARNDGGTVIKHLPDHWMKHGIGKFAFVDITPKTQVSHTGPDGGRIVTVTTKFECRPWVVIPLPVRVPGMNARYSFELTSRQPVESATDRN